MANTMTVTSPQLAGQPTQQGSNVLLSTGNFPNLLSGGTLTSTPTLISSQSLGVVITPVGTLTSDAVLILKGQVNGSQYNEVARWTGAEILAGDGGLAKKVDLKVLGIQFKFIPGATGAASGVNIRVID